MGVFAKYPTMWELFINHPTIWVVFILLIFIAKVKIKYFISHIKYEVYKNRKELGNMSILKKVALYSLITTFSVSAVCPYNVMAYADGWQPQTQSVIDASVSDNNIPDTEADISDSDAVQIPVGNIPEQKTPSTNGETCLIHYDLDGGEADNPETIFAGQSFILSNPVKEGYLFIGWIGSNGDEPEVDLEVIYSGEDLSYTAIWMKEDVSGNDFTVCAGTGITSNITYNLDGGQASNPSTIEEGVPFTLVNPTKNGYRFVGWTGSNGDVPQLDVEVIYTGNDLTYTANWEQEYTISYSYSGGNINWSEKKNPVKYTVSDEDITLVNPTRPSYKFMGWRGTDLTDVTKEVVIPKGSTGNRSYTAVFNSVSISFKCISGKYTGGSVSYSSSINEARCKTGDYLCYVTLTAKNGYYPDNIIVNDSQGNPISYEVISKENQLPWVKVIGFNLEDDVKATITCEAVSYAPNWDVSISGKTIYLTNYHGDIEKITIFKTYDILGENYSTNFPVNLPDVEKPGFKFIGWTEKDGDTPQTSYRVKYPSDTDSVTLNANWEAAYNINYDLDGGSYDSYIKYPKVYTEGDNVSLVTPKKNGYRFMGWTGSNGEVPALTYDIPEGTTGDLTFKANWQQEYKITINYASGNVSWSGKTNPTGYISSDEDIVLINPVKSGYVFVGWKGTNIDGTSKEVIIPSGSTGNRSYTAVYKQVRITFKQNSGKYKYGNVTCKSIISEENYKKGNYFCYVTLTATAGYYPKDISVTDSKGNPVSYEIIKNEGQLPWVRAIGFNLTDDLSYSINCVSESYVPDWEVSANVNAKKIILGNYLGNVDKIVLHLSYDVLDDKYSINFSFRLPNVEKEGFKFLGWTGSNGNKPQTNLYVNQPDSSVETLEYTANWAEAYNITYDLDGGSYDVNTQYPKIYTKGDNTKLVVPKKTGYYFIGWTGSNGDTPESEYRIPSNTTGDLNFKANWATGYSLTYNLNGGSTAWSGKENPTGYSSDDEDITLIAPTKEGYVFTGWQYAENGRFVTVKEMTIPHGSTKSYNFTAQYRQISVIFSQMGKYHAGSSGSSSSIDEARYKKGGFFVTAVIKNEDYSGYMIKNARVVDQDGNEIPYEIEDIENGKLIRFNLVENVFSYVIQREYESSVSGWDYSNYTDPNTGENFIQFSNYVGDGGEVTVKSHYVINGIDYSTLINVSSNNPLTQNGANITKITYEATDGRYIKLKYDSAANMFESLQKYNQSTNQYEDFWYGCKNVEEIDLSGVDLSNVSSITSMFNGCKKLKKITWGPFDTKNVKSLYYVFAGCESLENVDFLADWEIKDITNISNAFANCKKIKHLPIEHWDVSKVIYAFCMAYGCESLEDIDFINSWHFDSLDGADNDSLFRTCNSLKNVDITIHMENNTHQNITKNNYHFDQMFENCDNLENAKITFLLPDGAKPVEIRNILGYCKNLKTAKIKSTSGINNPDGCFARYDVLLDSLEKVEFDIPETEDSCTGSMSYMFRNTGKIKSIDLSSCHGTPTNMENAFLNNTSLEYLNISNLSLTSLNENDYHKKLFTNLTSLAKFDTPAYKASFDIPLPYTMVDLDGNEYDNIPDTSKTIYKPYYLTYDLDGGTVTSKNPANYTYDTPTFTLTNPTKENFDFKGWSEDGGVTTTKTVTIEKGSTQDRNFTAVWEEKSYNISKDIKGHGTVDVVDKAHAGDEVTITVTPDNGYKFSTIKIVDNTDTEIPCADTFRMPASDVTIKVTFAEIKKANPEPEKPAPVDPVNPKKAYKINVNIHGKGTIDVVNEAYADDKVTIGIKEAEGYKFLGVTIKDSNGNDITFTNYFTMPASDVTMDVSFGEIKKQIINPVKPAPEEPPVNPVEPEKPKPEELQVTEPDVTIEKVPDKDITETEEIAVSTNTSKKCYIHILIIVALIVFIFAAVFIKKESWRYRRLLTLANYAIVILCVILGFCKWDVILGIIDVILVLGINSYLNFSQKEKQEQE